MNIQAFKTFLMQILLTKIRNIYANFHLCVIFTVLFETLGVVCQLLNHKFSDTKIGLITQKQGVC